MGSYVPGYDGEMKRPAEVKPSVRCSGEPVAAAVSMCAAVSVTKHSPNKLLADDGAMCGVDVTKKRPRKADKRSEKGKKKRTKKKKRIEKIVSKPEKHAAGDGFIQIKKPTEVMGETAADENAAGGMMKLSQELLDYLRTKEVMGLVTADEAPLPPWAKRMAAGLDQGLKEEIAAEFHENREFDAHVLYQYRTCGFAYAQETAGALPEEKSHRSTRVMNQVEMGHYLSDEVWSYVMSIGVTTFEDAVISEIEMSHDLATEDTRLAARRRRIENQANMLRQYRTNGHAVLQQYQVTDDES